MIIERINFVNAVSKSSALDSVRKHSTNVANFKANENDVFVSNQNQNVSFNGAKGAVAGFFTGSFAGVALCFLCPPVGAAFVSSSLAASLAGAAAIGTASVLGAAGGTVAGDKIEDAIKGSK